MGFKKTSEGRVFFQGADGNNTAGEARSSAKPMSGSQQVQVGPTQLQILSLLRSLNDKLKMTQTERAAMRTEIDEYRRSMGLLQDKAHKGERAEKIAQETLKELEETRKLVLDLEERQSGVEKEQKASSERIRTSVGGYRELAKRIETTEQKQDEITRKVEETVAQQARVMRQIEKAIEDRTRFMRKIERIEETVIQTRDALNAKAMVLLTDQNISGSVSTDIDNSLKASAPGIPAALPEEKIQAEAWSASRALQAAAILLLVIGAILAGWAVSEMRRAEKPDSGEFQISDNTEAVAAAPSAGENYTEQNVSTDSSQKIDEIVNKWNVNENTEAFASEKKPDPTDDIGTIDLNDQAKLQRMLEENPDALAAELNKIEPSSIPVSADDSGEVKIASLPVEETKNIESDVPVQVTNTANLREQMSPDSALTDAVKKIEDQAFEGVPEAQHDLAAIYTAGHGGVKQNFKRALFWFEQASAAGISNAAYNLGVLYHQGLGTKPDLAKAIGHYTRAADMGHPEAQYNLGIAYIEGVGVKYDPFKAKGYFEKAAQQGITEASYNLGLIYENGLLGKPEPAVALDWYKKAADKGSPEAKEALKQLAKTLNIREEDINTVVGGAKPSGQPAPATLKNEKRAETSVQNEQAMLAQIQENLMGRGLYPGPADGMDSPQLQDAIRVYQARNGMSTTGKPSAALLVHMLSNGESKASSTYN